MFTSRTRKDVKVEVGPEQYEVVTIRKISGVSLDKAAEAHRIDVINIVKGYGAELLGFSRAKAAEKAEELPAPKPVEPVVEPELTPEQKEAQLKTRREARYGEYDRQLVLQAGIVSWSDKDAKVNAESIADLDDAISKLLCREILDLSLPALEDDSRLKG